MIYEICKYLPPHQKKKQKNQRHSQTKLMQKKCLGKYFFSLFLQKNQILYIKTNETSPKSLQIQLLLYYK